MLHNCVHSLYVYRSTSLSWLQRVAITRLTLKGCRRPARRDLVCTHTRQLFLRPTSHLLLRCLHQRHSRYNQLRRSMCNLRKRGGVRAQVAPVHPLLYTCRHRRSRSRSRDSGRSRKGSRRDRRSGSRSSRRHRKSRRHSRSGSRHRSKKSKKSRRHVSSSSSSSRSPSPRRGDRTRHGSSRQTHSAQYDQGMGYQQGQQFMAPYGKPQPYL